MHKHELHMRLQQKITYESRLHHRNKGQLIVHIITLKSFEAFLELRISNNKRLEIQYMSPRDKVRSLELIYEFLYQMKR
jgi:hypothetical protein